MDLVKSVGGTRGGERGPILVHCSAGLGRSGVFVAVHSSLETQAEGTARIDLETTVREMRKQRGGMVQTPDQYRFCFEAVAEALDPVLPPTEEEEFRPPVGTQSLSKHATSPQPQVSNAPPLPPRPSSQTPLQQQETRSVKIRKSSIPQSQPQLPPSEEDIPNLPPFQDEDILKRVSSPPPPSSSPPPPLTPSTSETPDDTPTKYPFLETSPEATPTKQPTSDEIPDICVTPPTRHESLSSMNQDFESMDRKSKASSFARHQERGKRTDSGFQELPQDLALPPEKSSAVRTASKVKNKQDTPPQRSKNHGAVKTSSLPQTEPVDGEKKESRMTEDELKETLSGFEVPPPGKDEGFEIGDDQTTEAGFPPKMEVMKKSSEETTRRPRWGGGSLLTKMEGVSKTVPSSSLGKPRKWGQSHSQTPRPPPEPVNQTRTDDRIEKLQKVGKLVIPSIFGSGGVTPHSTSPTMPLKKSAISDSQPVRPVPEPVRPVSPPPAKLDTTTPPVLRMIRKIEAPQLSSPAFNAPPTVEQKLVKPVVPEPVKLVKQDSQPLPATSVKTLLARFEKNT